MSRDTSHFTSPISRAAKAATSIAIAMTIVGSTGASALASSRSATSSPALASPIITPRQVAAVVASDTAINNRANASLSLSLQNSHEACIQQTLDDAMFKGDQASGEKSLGSAFDQVPTHDFVPRETTYPASFSVLAADRAAGQPTTNDLLTYMRTSVSSTWKLAWSSEILGPTDAGVAVPAAALDSGGFATTLPTDATDDLSTAPDKVAATVAKAFTTEASSGKLPSGIAAQFGPKGLADPHAIAASYAGAGSATMTFSGTTPPAAAAAAPSASCPYPAIRLANGGALVTFTLFTTIVLHVKSGSVVVQPSNRSNLGALLAPGAYSELTLVFGDPSVAIVPPAGSHSPIDVIGQANEGLSESGVEGSGSPSSNATGAPKNAAAIASSVDPAVVDIDVALKYQNESAAGTGMVLTPNGEILTNNHVIEGETSIKVTDVGNNKTYGARVVGYDRTSDVAVLQLVDASGLRTVSLGNSSAVKAGLGVVGIGNAGGNGGVPSYAGGSITALNQSITAGDESDGTSENLTGLLATNAGIEPGDSGGPLVSAAGKVIGMDTAASAGFQFQAAGILADEAFAIPIDTATSIAKQLESGTSSSTLHVGPTAFFGVTTPPPSGNGSGPGGFGTGIGGGLQGSSGAEIIQVFPGSPAAGAGITAGDTVTSFDGQAVASGSAFTTLIESKSPGTKATVVYLDSNGVRHTTTVTLASGPPQ